MDKAEINIGSPDAPSTRLKLEQRGSSPGSSVVKRVVVHSALHTQDSKIDQSSLSSPKSKVTQPQFVSSPTPAQVKKFKISQLKDPSLELDRDLLALQNMSLDEK